MKLHTKMQRYAYVETFVITSVFIALGYFFQPDDVLLIKNDLTLLTGFLAVITLFFGLGSGLFSLGMLTLIMIAGYSSFEYQIFLKELVLVFIYGEFHAYWHKQILFYRRKTDTLESRFQDVSKAFYALKVSHDQLEMNYVLKPVSLRRSLVQIIENMEKKDEDHWQNLAVLIEKSFGITKLSLCILENNTCSLKASSTQQEIDMHDPLVEKALESTLPVYIPEHVKETSEYIAVIPAVFHNETKAMLLIQEMPFMSFKEDNLIAIRFIFDYFFLILHKEEILRNSNLLPEFSAEFRFAYINQYELFERYGIDSTFIVFKTEDALISHRLSDEIEQTLRDLDQHDTIERNGIYLSIVMTPFSAKESARGLQKRILDHLKEKEREALEVTLFTFSQKELFERYIKEA